jgi:hypothetical protein
MHTLIYNPSGNTTTMHVNGSKAEKVSDRTFLLERPLTAQEDSDCRGLGMVTHPARRLDMATLHALCGKTNCLLDEEVSEIMSFSGEIVGFLLPVCGRRVRVSLLVKGAHTDGSFQGVLEVTRPTMTPKGARHHVVATLDLLSVEESSKDSPEAF